MSRLQEFYKSHDAFMARMSNTALAKSMRPGDFGAIKSAVDPKGADTVDHTPHLVAHPHTIQHLVDRFKRAAGGESPVVKRSKAKLDGISKKVVYDLSDPSNIALKHRVMVKPYHEGLHSAVGSWQQHLIQGWAEMTNQALFHAAGIGHLHQNVHTDEHNMGPTAEREPGLVIHMAHDTTPVHQLFPHELINHDGDNLRAEALRIGAMDFLANNIDRHAANLHLRDAGSVDENGIPHRSSLLAIDHTRNFQYKSSVKSVVRKKRDADGNIVSIPEGERDNPAVDNFLNYLKNSGMTAIDRHLQSFNDRLIRQPDLHDLGTWWAGVGHAVRSEFEHHLQSIKNPAVRQHLQDNFEERAKVLDKISRDPAAYSMYARLGGKNNAHFNVPVLPFGA